MKWFKHLTDASLDQKLAILLDHMGSEGYGAYWLIIEAIARNVDEKDITFLEFSTKTWQKITHFSPKKLKFFINICENNGIFIVKNGGDMIAIDCPNLLKYRDEWTRKQKAKIRSGSGVRPEENREREDTETDIEKNREREVISSNTREVGSADSLSPDGRVKNNRLAMPFSSVPDSWVDWAEEYQAKHNLQWSKTAAEVAAVFVRHCKQQGTLSRDWRSTFEKFVINERPIKKSAKNGADEARADMYTNALYGSVRKRKRDSDDYIDGEVINVH